MWPVLGTECCYQKKARRPPLAVKDFGCVYLVGLLCCMEQEAWGKISPVAWAKVLHSRNDQMCVLKDGQRTRATISKHNYVLFIRKADTFFSLDGCDLKARSFKPYTSKEAFPSFPTIAQNDDVHPWEFLRFLCVHCSCSFFLLDTTRKTTGLLVWEVHF